MHPPRRRLAGFARVVHPFPSLLDGAVVALVAIVAGGEPGVVARLAASMVGLQFAIGAVNDIVDVPFDVRRGDKPIPTGMISARQAAVVALLGAAIGLGLAASVGPLVLVLAIAVLGIGLGYDLWAKGTALSWLPFAVGIPVLPVYGWLGAQGGLPPEFTLLVPLAALEGGVLAVANALVDHERDVVAGSRSVATALGLRRSGIAVVAGQAVVALSAIATLVAVSPAEAWLAVGTAAALVPVGGAVLGLVGALRGGPGMRERAWEIQAVGAGLLAAAWIAGRSAGVS